MTLTCQHADDIPRHDGPPHNVTSTTSYQPVAAAESGPSLGGRVTFEQGARTVRTSIDDACASGDDNAGRRRRPGEGQQPRVAARCTERRRAPWSMRYQGERQRAGRVFHRQCTY
jgi:hypothetical protein